MASSSSSLLLRQTPSPFQPKPTTQSSIKPTTTIINTLIIKKLPSFRISNKPRLTLTTKPKQSGPKMNATAASSYAAALAEVANTTNTLEITASDVENISTIFSDPPVADFFASPVISLERKREVLDEITTAASFQPHTVNFLNILLDMKRIDIIKEILKEFETVYNKLTDTELAIVTSVVPLGSDHLEEIEKGVKKLTGAKNVKIKNVLDPSLVAGFSIRYGNGGSKLTGAKNVKIKNVLDPSLVAGFSIRYGNGGSKLIDMSVKKQLEEIASQLDLGDIKLAV